MIKVRCQKTRSQTICKSGIINDYVQNNSSIDILYMWYLYTEWKDNTLKTPPSYLQTNIVFVVFFDSFSFPTTTAHVCDVCDGNFRNLCVKQVAPELLFQYFNRCYNFVFTTDNNIFSNNQLYFVWFNLVHLIHTTNLFSNYKLCSEKFCFNSNYRMQMQRLSSSYYHLKWIQAMFHSEIN